MSEENEVLCSTEERSCTAPTQPSRIVYIQRERRLPTFRGDGFDNTSAEEWAEEIRRGIRGMTDADAADCVIDHLEGPARREILLLPGHLQASDKAVLRAVLNAFGDRRSTGALRDALYNRNQQPNETVREYSNALQSLVALLQSKVCGEEAISPRALCERFVEGLRSGHLRARMRRQLSTAEWADFDDLRRQAIERELEYESFTPPHATTAAIAAETSVTARLEALTSTVAQLQAALEKTLQSPKDTRITCAYCRKRGHTAAECRTRLRKEGGARQPTARQQGTYPVGASNKQCYHCGQWGHIRRNCPHLLPPAFPSTEQAAPMTAQVSQTEPRLDQHQGNLSFPQ